MVATTAPVARTAARAPVVRRVPWTWVALLALAVAVLLSLLVGSRAIGPDVVWRVLTGQAIGGPLDAIVEARIPRTAAGLAAGAALGLAGAVMQGLTRNPLADPGVLGINAGAALAMVVALSAFGVSTLSGYLWFAFAGAAIAALVVHGLASIGRGGASPYRLAVTGAAFAAGVTSWTSAVLLQDRRTMDVFRYWQVGSIGGRTGDAVLTVLPFLVVGAVLALTGGRLLDTLVLGEDLARGLGRRVGVDRAVLGLAVVLLCGGATALAGPIAFVGLVVPHAVRALAGPAHHRLLPLSAVGGALLVLVADVAGRVVLPPTEVQVGIMTAVVGAPVFGWLVRRGRAGAS
jgi:iron complex transport system permease protein